MIVFICLLGIALNGPMASAASYPVRPPAATGGALGRMFVQEHVVYAYSIDELYRLLPDVQARLSALASRWTAFDRLSYDRVTAAGGHALSGHCGAIAYVVQRLFGGEAMVAKFRDEAGHPFVHMWNRLPILRPHGTFGTRDFDLSKPQFGFAEGEFAPAKAFRYEGRDYRLSDQPGAIEFYRWDEDADHPLRIEIAEFYTKFLSATCSSALDRT